MFSCCAPQYCATVVGRAAAGWVRVGEGACRSAGATARRTLRYTCRGCMSALAHAICCAPLLDGPASCPRPPPVLPPPPLPSLHSVCWLRSTLLNRPWSVAACSSCAGLVRTTSRRSSATAAATCARPTRPQGRCAPKVRGLLSVWTPFWGVWGVGGGVCTV